MDPDQTTRLLATAYHAQQLFILLLVLVCVILGFGCGGGHNLRPIIFTGLVIFASYMLAGATTELSAKSSHIFRLPEPYTLTGLSAIKLGLYIDLVAAFVFTIFTGGAVRSAYGPLLFFLPTLGILLLQQDQSFLFQYVGATSILFLLALPPYPIHYLEKGIVTEREELDKKLSEFSWSTKKVKTTEWAPFHRAIIANYCAFIVVTLICFWLSFYIGTQTL